LGQPYFSRSITIFHSRFNLGTSSASRIMEYVASHRFVGSTNARQRNWFSFPHVGARRLVLTSYILSTIFLFSRSTRIYIGAANLCQSVVWWQATVDIDGGLGPIEELQRVDV
jgi:hypothetical protein